MVGRNGVYRKIGLFINRIVIFTTIVVVIFCSGVLYNQIEYIINRIQEERQQLLIEENTILNYSLENGQKLNEVDLIAILNKDQIDIEFERFDRRKANQEKKVLNIPISFICITSYSMKKCKKLVSTGKTESGLMGLQLVLLTSYVDLEDKKNGITILGTMAFSKTFEEVGKSYITASLALSVASKYVLYISVIFLAFTVISGMMLSNKCVIQHLYGVKAVPITKSLFVKMLIIRCISCVGFVWKMLTLYGGVETIIALLILSIFVRKLVTKTKNIVYTNKAICFKKIYAFSV